MNKPLKSTLITILIVVLLAGAALTVYYFCRPKGQSRDEIEISPINNTYIAYSGQNITTCSPRESLFILAYRVKHLNSYSTTISGEVNAGGIYKQDVSGEKYIVGKDSVYVSRSTSFLKNTADQIFINSNTALVRNGDPKTNVYEDTVKKYTLSQYFEEYGTYYRELSNYELNDSTITNAELVSAENGLYTYKYEINVEKGVNAYRVNMYKMGSLSELPTFKTSMLTVTMTTEFMPVSITQIDEYSINMFFNLNCTSTLTENFEKLNDNSVVIPDYEFFKTHLGD